MHRYNAQQQRQNATQQRQNAAQQRNNDGAGSITSRDQYYHIRVKKDDYAFVITMIAFLLTCFIVAIVCPSKPVKSTELVVQNTTEDIPEAFIHIPSDEDVQNCTRSCVAAATASVRTLYKLGVNIGMIRYGSFVGVHICGNLTYVDCADICSKQGWVVA